MLCISTKLTLPFLWWNRKIDKVDATMDQIREQMEISNEISDAISNPVNMGIDVDDVSQGFL